MAVVLRASDVAADQSDVFDLVVDVAVADSAELAVPGGYPCLRYPLDVLFVLAPPLDEVGDGDQGQPMLVGEDPQLVGLGHRAFVLLADDLADRAGRLQAGHPGQIDRRLGMARAAQDAAGLGTQRHDMARLGEVIGDTRRVGQQSHRGRPVRCRDPGSHAMFGVDGDGVGGAVLVLVDCVHRQQTQPVADVAVQRNAEVPGGVADHERHQFRRGLLGREDQVALVLAVLVVDDDDGFPRRDVGYRPLDGVQSRHRCRLPGVLMVTDPGC